MVWMQRCNPGILLASLLLTGFGIVSVYSASAIIAMERHQDPYFSDARCSLLSWSVSHVGGGADRLSPAQRWAA